MEQQNHKKISLDLLITLELVGISFIRDYIQFIFDDPLLNTYTLPQVKIHGRILSSKDNGYYDILCSLIGKIVLNAYEDEKEERLIIQFNNDIELNVSLKSEDRDCVEAAMLRLEPKGEWIVW